MRYLRPDEGTAQCGRRIVRAAPRGDGVTEHFPNPAARADGGFVLAKRFNRADSGQDIRRCDFSDRILAKAWPHQAQSHSAFSTVTRVFPSWRFFLISSLVMASNVLALAIRLLAFSRRFLVTWINLRFPCPLGLIARPADIFKPDGRILPERELLLFASKSVGEAPQFRARRLDPKLQASTVRELHGLVASGPGGLIAASLSIVGLAPHVGDNGLLAFWPVQALITLAPRPTF